MLFESAKPTLWLKFYRVLEKPRALSKLKAIRTPVSARLCKEPIPLCQVHGIRTWLFLYLLSQISSLLDTLFQQSDLHFLCVRFAPHFMVIEKIDRLFDE